MRRRKEGLFDCGGSTSRPAPLVPASPVGRGIAERGETCGAVTGCLLALGLVFGRERLDDWAGWRACLVPARAFCDGFVTEMGSTQCADVVEKIFGHRYNLADPADLARFQDAGPTAKCGGVVRRAVRLAAGLILDKGRKEIGP